MPGDIPVGNGKLLVCFDQNYCIRGLHFPQGSEKNNTGRCFCRMGVWVDRHFSWVGADWKRDFRYIGDTLVTQVRLEHEEMKLLLVCHDTVDFLENIYIREIYVENHYPEPRQIRLFFNQSFNASGSEKNERADRDEKTGGVIHRGGSHCFLVNGCTEDGEGLDQFFTEGKELSEHNSVFENIEETFFSDENGVQAVYSVVDLTLTVESRSVKRAYYWIAADRDEIGVQFLDTLIRYHHPENLMQRTADYWHLWAHKETPPLEHLPSRVGQLYQRSLLILRTQIDSQGGVIDSCPSDGLSPKTGESYTQLRDGIFVAHALDLAGYIVLAQNYYSFVAALIEPRTRNNSVSRNFAKTGDPGNESETTRNFSPQSVQEDEIAMFIWALWHHFVLYRDIEFIRPLYSSVIGQAADFMCEHRDGETGLPAASYDPWTKRYGIHSFVAGAVFGGLTAASLFCIVFGQSDKAAKYQKAATEIRRAVSAYLWRNELNRFCRTITRNDFGEIETDPLCDADLWGLFAFGMYAVDDPRIVSTMSAVKEALWMGNDEKGMVRHEGEISRSADGKNTGNPSLVSSLRLADYLAERARDEVQMNQALDILIWVSYRAFPSGVLGERAYPVAEEPRSKSPFVLSHAAFVTSTQRILRRLAGIRTCPHCGSSPLHSKRNEDWIDRLYAEACDIIRKNCKVN